MLPQGFRRLLLGGQDLQGLLELAVLRGREGDYFLQQPACCYLAAAREDALEASQIRGGILMRELASLCPQLLQFGVRRGLLR